MPPSGIQLKTETLGEAFQIQITAPANHMHEG